MEPKRAWSHPESRPLTEADSRADVDDVPTPNGIAVSEGPN
jgi:hypothetical protein